MRRRCVSAQARTPPFPSSPPEKHKGKKSAVEQRKVCLRGYLQVCSVCSAKLSAEGLILSACCLHVSTQLRISVVLWVLCDERKHDRCGTNLAEADLREFAARSVVYSQCDAVADEYEGAVVLIQCQVASVAKLLQRLCHRGHGGASSLTFITRANQFLCLREQRPVDRHTNCTTRSISPLLPDTLIVACRCAVSVTPHPESGTGQPSPFPQFSTRSTV